MKDPRAAALAKQLLVYCTEVTQGDVLFLEVKGKEALELGKEIIRLASERGATTFWYYSDDSLLRQWLLAADRDQFRTQAEMQLQLMKRANAYIGLRGSDNPFDLADIPAETMEQFNSLFYKPVHLEERVKRTRWVVLRYPNNSMATLAESSQEQFEEYYYQVCCANYEKMSRAQDRLVTLMEKTDKVHIKGPGTDLRFSIKDIPVVKCDGKRNIPDGEVYTAPVRDSIEGTIAYNTPSLYQGTVFNGITFRFEKGFIVEATCDGDVAKLNKILDTDEGARGVGEFSLGLNPFIRHPMRDTLFDEKIAGSLHLTPGQCYDEAPNGNTSSIHWDLVLIQRSDYGGGEIWFDDELIRKDGVFTNVALEAEFSAENLKGI